METVIPDNLFESVKIQDIISEAKDYALCNGIIFRFKAATSDDLVQLAPITVFPSPFPKHCFDEAKSIQSDVNLLMHQVSHDNIFLNKSLERVIKTDSFTREMYVLHEKLLKHGSAQTYKLGLLRSDYMTDEKANLHKLRQIEVNVIAAGFAIMGPKLSRFHHYIMSKYRPDGLDRLPHNECDVNFAKAFIATWDFYNNSRAVILFVIEDRTINLSDQRSMEFLVTKMRPDIVVIRKSLTQLVECAELKDNQLLIIDKKYEVALVYFRNGYDPSHYVNSDYWDLRYLIEKSKAIKCPSISYQLAGTKIVQEKLSEPGSLERFLGNRSCQRLRDTFAGMWSLEFSETGNRMTNTLIQNYDDYVLKPQREGGGNNLYGYNIANFLTSIKDSDSRESYIAMERIRPIVTKNLLVRPNIVDYDLRNLDSELGIFGTLLGNKNEILWNKESGHVLRSKLVEFNEGGVSSGQGVIDSPYLY